MVDSIPAIITKRVHELYWNDDVNCATTSLTVLSEQFSQPMDSQVIDSLLGMHGAACYGAQCGLVEGPLLFLGIYGRSKKIEDSLIREACYNYAASFETRFESLLCGKLRPGGFNDDDREHLCESLTVDAVSFAVDYIAALNW
jgi:hypothetical protein